MDRPTAIKRLAGSLERQTGKDCTAEAASAITFAEQIEERIYAGDVVRIIEVLPRSTEREKAIKFALDVAHHRFSNEELKIRIWAILGVK